MRQTTEFSVLQDLIYIFQEELERWVPSSTVSSLGQKDAAHVQTQTHARALRVHLEGLDDLRKDRAQFVQRAQRLAKADDIQPLILKQASSLEQWVEVEPAMFESILDEEISKYEKFKDSIMENAEKQSELLELVKVRQLMLPTTNVALNPNAGAQ